MTGPDDDDDTDGDEDEDVTLGGSPEAGLSVAAGGKLTGVDKAGVRIFPASGGPLKFDALHASWMAVHLFSQMGQFLLPVGPAEL